MTLFTFIGDQIKEEIYKHTEAFFNNAVVWEHCNGYGATLKTDCGEKYDIFAPTVEDIIVKIYEES